MQSQRERLEHMCFLDIQTAAVCAVLFKTKHKLLIHLGSSPLLTPASSGDPVSASVGELPVSCAQRNADSLWHGAVRNEFKPSDTESEFETLFENVNKAFHFLGEILFIAYPTQT